MGGVVFVLFALFYFLIRESYWRFLWFLSDLYLPPGDSGLCVLQRLKDEIAEVANEIENLGSTEER